MAVCSDHTYGTPTPFNSLPLSGTNRFSDCRLADRCQTLGGDYPCKSVTRNSVSRALSRSGAAVTIANTSNPKNREEESANPHERNI